MQGASSLRPIPDALRALRFFLGLRVRVLGLGRGGFRALCRDLGLRDVGIYGFRV